MSASILLHTQCSCSAYVYSVCCRNQTLPSTHSPFLSSKSFLTLKKHSLLSKIDVKVARSRQSRSSYKVFAAQSNFLKVLQTVWRVGKDGVEAGTSLVPDIVPRPVARIAVTVVTLSVSLFVLKSILSTAFFVLATMGLAYFTFIALNKDEAVPREEGGRSSAPMEDPLEEARKIMEKYK